MIRSAGFLLRFVVVAFVIFALVVIATNTFLSTPRDVAFRALDPSSAACDPGGPGWTIFSEDGNSELDALARSSAGGPDWRTRLRCAVQKHRLPDYQPETGHEVAPHLDLAYNLAFLEFQEDGAPYVLCNEKEYADARCDGDGFVPTDGAPETHRSQLEALLDVLKRNGEKNYVVAFVHGWRNDAQLGNENVADTRIYAAEAVRYVTDRCIAGDPRFCGMKVTAIFVGWRGARTDEARISGWGRALARPFCGGGACWITNIFDRWATAGALFTLFDRKPVSETVAPAVVSALRAVESQIGLQTAFRQEDLAPCEYARGAPLGCVTSGKNAKGPQARMIVFGHSLGGNMLATGLLDTTLKQVERHQSGEFEPPPLGNLVVLINPAAEAVKWTAIQRAVWDRVSVYASDKGRAAEIIADRKLFRAEQRPVIVSVTSARDWPPGGIWAPDCADLLKLGQQKQITPGDQDILKAYADFARRERKGTEYDWATYDAFPAFRFDFRSLASTLDRDARVGAVSRMKSARNLGSDDLPVVCDSSSKYSWRGRVERLLGAALRTFPFMDTNVEQTRAIGHLDPVRSVQSIQSGEGVSPRPFGTTHQLVGWSDTGRDLDGVSANKLERLHGYRAARDAPVTCPRALNWLSAVRDLQMKETGRMQGWDAIDLEHDPPALRFEHGFYPAHLPPITLGGDPFWNIRVIDDVLAQHDGFVRSNFICAMQQLVLDDVTTISPPEPKAGAVGVK